MWAEGRGENNDYKSDRYVCRFGRKNFCAQSAVVCPLNFEREWATVGIVKIGKKEKADADGARL